MLLLGLLIFVFNSLAVIRNISTIARLYFRPDILMAEVVLYLLVFSYAGMTG